MQPYGHIYLLLANGGHCPESKYHAVFVQPRGTQPPSIHKVPGCWERTRSGDYRVEWLGLGVITYRASEFSKLE